MGGGGGTPPVGRGGGGGGLIPEADLVSSNASLSPISSDALEKNKR